MSKQFGPLALSGLTILTLIGFGVSYNPFLWAVSCLALLIIIWLAGGTGTSRALLWIIGLCWFSIIGDVIAGDLKGESITGGPIGPYRETAIYFSLFAMMSMAAGMNAGKQIGERVFHLARRSVEFADSWTDRQFNVLRLVVGYVFALGITEGLSIIARAIPSLAQPVLAVGLIKYVFIYLLAATVIDTRRGARWLILVATIEMLTGMLSYFASYKEAVFVILIAFGSARRRFGPAVWGLGVAAIALIFWISMVWTVVKSDYRANVFNMTFVEKVAFISNRYLYEDIAYQAALSKLFERIGYTSLYAAVIAKEDLGSLPREFNFYTGAVQHVLTPRVLFPDKAQLNDLILTKALLGMSIAEGTSIGVGYVAQAHVDFGFPGLGIPLFLIGAMLGLAAQYFLTRPVPRVVCELFATSSLFLCFAFETDIDKALGGFITGCLAMAVAVKFGYPIFRRWIVDGRTGERNRSSVTRVTL